MNKKMMIALLSLAMMLSATGCTPAEPVENDLSSSITQEEYDSLQAERDQLQKELDELKAEREKAEEEQPSEEDAKEEANTSSAASGNENAAVTSNGATSQENAPANDKPAPTVNNTNPTPANNQAPVENTPPVASSLPPATKVSSTGKGPLAKYTVNVFDSTTPAASTVGTTYNGQMVYMFYSSSQKELGTIPENQLNQIIWDNQLMDMEADEQLAWFTKQYNVYRGLDGSNEHESAGSSSTASSVPSSNEFDIDEFRDEVIRLTNIEREKAGLEALVEDSTAMEYAQIRAEELAVSYSHTRPNNQNKSMNGLEFIENIAYGQKSAKEVVNDWMNSPGHKATLLSDYSSYGSRFGVGCYEKNGTIYWTQEFVLWDAEG